jgi:UDP-N-acetylmuramyl pentapeptide phosphotransferase/UDP-N-acetylglucosamine-1-phosphate transferase
MKISWEVIYTSLLIIVGSTLLSYILNIFFRRLAIRTQVVDKPRVDRFHDQHVPLLGGNAIYLTFLAGLVFKGMINPWVGLVLLVGLIILLYGLLRQRHRLAYYIAFAVIWCSAGGIIAADNSQNQLLGLLLGGTILLFMGNVDDASGGIYAHVKLIGQAIAAFFLIYFGIKVHFFTDIGYEWGIDSLRYLTFPFTLFWIIGMTNAFNLIDNMNGLSCGVAVISSLFFALISLVIGQVELAYILFIFMGAGLGYLPHNFPRARIFMGDAGSMFIGFVIASLSIVGSWSTAAGWVADQFKISLTIPILVLIYPIFDTILVTVTRILRGRPISLGGKDHSSHRLVKMGLGPADAVLLIYTFCSFAGFCALFLTMIRYKQALLMLAFLVLFITLVGLRLGKIRIQE